MIVVKCTYSNGDTTITSINGTLEDAKQYFLGKRFNVGQWGENTTEGENLQKCINVELLKD